ncbi:hypothetical protein D3C76_1582940 [compost metagenome]
MHSPCLPACRLTRLQCAEQTRRQAPFAALKRVDHALDHVAVGQQVTRRDTLLACQGVVCAQGVVATEYRSAPLCIDDRYLAVLAVAIAGQCMVQRLTRR